MHPLHATLEEFATEGYTHQLPALLRETIAGNRPACENLDGTHPDRSQPACGALTAEATVGEEPWQQTDAVGRPWGQRG